MKMFKVKKIEILRRKLFCAFFLSFTLKKREEELGAICTYTQLSITRKRIINFLKNKIFYKRKKNKICGLVFNS